MPVLGFACLTFATAAFAVQYASSFLAALRCRRRRSSPVPAQRPPVTLVRPLRGLEPFSRETLSSTFAIEYPAIEILFCVEDEDDPVLPLVRTILAEHPGHDARILIGADSVGANPKLNNMAKGFRQSSFEHIVFVDSNVYTPPDYLDQLMAALQDGAGMVTAPPVGGAPVGFWADLECAFLNSYQARMQYAIDALGRGFAQGKTLCFHRVDLDNGGFARLAEEPAEDAAATRMMMSGGRRIRLAGPFAQLIGPRSAAQVWKRQLRWARLRRASFPLLFAPECLAGPVPPLLALLAGLASFGVAPAGAVLAFIALWYLPELLLLRVAGWPRSLPALLARDLLLPMVFLGGCAGTSFEWHGRPMTADRRSGATSRLTRMHPRLLWGRFASRNPFG